MVELGTLGTAIGSSYQQWLPAIVMGVFWSLIIAIIGAIAYGIYLFTQYKYKVFVDVRGRDGSTKRSYVDRARVIEDDGLSKWKLLLKNKKIKPPEFENVKPNNWVHLQQVGDDEFIDVSPSPIMKEGKHIFYTTPFKQDVKAYQQTLFKQIALKYTPDNTKQQMYIAAGVVGFCLLLAAFTVWFSLKTAQTSTADIKLVASALEGLKGIAPQ